jgi:biopolymer transport protein ExbD
MTAATARTRVQLEPAADPNVIPFIDVLLVLLIIFMVTAPKPTTDMRVDLPRSTVGPASPIEPTIVHIRSGAAGARYFVDAEEASLGAR